MIEFKCRQCGESMEAPESDASSHFECPKCGVMTILPSIEDESAQHHHQPHSVKSSPEEPLPPLKIHQMVIMAFVVIVFGFIVVGWWYDMKDAAMRDEQRNEEMRREQSEYFYGGRQAELQDKYDSQQMTEEEFKEAFDMYQKGRWPN